MSGAVTPARARALIGLPCATLLAVAVGAPGCASVAQDVDAYYRQMAINYHEAEEQAKLEETTLQKQSSVLAVTGESNKLKRTQRRLARIKAWEEKCAKEATRFEKAAEWTEAHFRLEKPVHPGDSPGHASGADADVRQAGGTVGPEPGS